MQEVFTRQLLKSPCAKHWKKIGLHPHNGIVCMLSSLHSKSSPLCGDFEDLKALIDLCTSWNFDFIQLLPLNDSGFDNSPYNPTSTLAFNPIYLSLNQLPHLRHHNKLKKELEKINQSPVSNPFDYSKARKYKFQFLNQYFVEFKELILRSADFKRFATKNVWCEEYGIFNALAEVLHTNDWRQWPKVYQKPTQAKIKKWRSQHQDRILFYMMVQYFCFKQMKSVKQYADKKKLFLLGDLPFLVSKSSFDVWQNQSLFYLNVSVGSPPDDLTPEGQNWDFPAYHWDNHLRSDYQWWKHRLKYFENFFHIYRLDHIIGFFRTWNIPEGKRGVEGAYCPEDPSVWLQKGYDFLKMVIQNCNMLPIGEDLVIPQTVKDVLRELGICGTNILTWQRTGAGGMDFVPFPLYNVASMTHLASHDTATLNQWWSTYSDVAKLYAQWKGWKFSKTLTKKMRLSLLHDSHQTASLFHANLLQEYLALFPEMVHKDFNKERINYPGTPSKKNWRYRFVPSLEKMAQSQKLSDAMHSLLQRKQLSL